MRRTSVSALGTILAVAAALSGCSSGSSSGGDDGSEPAIATIANRTSSNDLQLPLDQFIPSDRELSQIQAAYRVRLRQCVAEYRLEYNPSLVASPVTGTGRNARRYGVTNGSEVRVYGFRQPPEALTRRPQQPEPPAQLQTVLTGKGPATVNGRPVLPGGCIAKAQADVNGGASTAEDMLAQRLSSEGFSRSQSDSRVRAVMSRWSACMKERGFNYATPDNATGDPQFASAASASKAEISTAEADVRCKQRTNLVGVWAAVETAYQSRLVSQNQEALETIRKHQAEKMKNAARLVSLPQ